jgi:hypothetical protein
MIENARAASSLPLTAVRLPAGKVLRMRTDDDRINGSYPVWEDRATAQGSVEGRLSAAAQDAAGTAADAPPANALAYADQPGGANQPQEFGFGDLLDIVNPLQHIPVVNEIYRHMTGDTIRPISNIVGGALYGGFAGAALSLGDTVVQYETGKNTADNMVALVTQGKGPSFRDHPTSGTPEQRLNEAARLAQNTQAGNSGNLSDLPGTTLSFADMKQTAPATIEPAAGGDDAPVSRANISPYARSVPQPDYND